MSFDGLSLGLADGSNSHLASFVAELLALVLQKTLVELHVSFEVAVTILIVFADPEFFMESILELTILAQKRVYFAVLQV